MKSVSRRRRAGQALRPPMRSPGRPPGWRREHGQRFWDAIARGLSSEEAARAAGLSQAVGTRGFRESGGMRTVPTTSLSGRYLSFVEREEIAILKAQGRAVREIGRRMGRSWSTISRELRRNAATRSGILDYRTAAAQWHADRRAKRPKAAKLAFRSLKSSPFSRAHPTHPPIELIVGWGAPPGLCPGPASWTRDGADA
jgi:hypothetical protein